MKTKNIIIGTILTLSIVAVAAIAYADYGYGPGAMMGGGYRGGHMMGPGYGGGYMMGPGYGGGYMMGRGGHMMDWDGAHGYYYGDDGLTAEQKVAIETAQKKFYDETIDLRRQLDARQYELNSEIYKNNPDKAKIESLEKDIAKLRTDLDQKSVKHALEMRKLLPESDQGQAYGAWSGGNGRYCW